MFRKDRLVVGFLIGALAASVHGQSPAESSAVVDFETVCERYGEAELVVGRAREPVTLRISGEAEIEKARQNLIRVEAEVAHLRATLDLQTRWEREKEFALKVIEAQTELDLIKALFPPPQDFAVIPVDVEQTFRGVITPTFLLHRRDPSLDLRPGELYLISGRVDRHYIPGLPGRPDFLDLEYVEAARVIHVASAQRELRFLGLTTSGASIDGSLKMHSYGAIGAPLGGIRIVVFRNTTRPNDDGTFEFFGVFPGSYFLFARLEKITDGKRRYFTTYFPGTPDLAHAQPIIVGKATGHDGFDFLVTTE
jgi:hypothetical protein